MIEGTIATKLKKRRVIFVDDGLWSTVEQFSQQQEISCSEALRQILSEVKDVKI